MDEKKMQEAIDAFGRDFPKRLPIEQEYLEFSRFVQSCFISKDGYIIDTGSYRDVNYELMHRIQDSIKRHPKLWKLFFMVA